MDVIFQVPSQHFRSLVVLELMPTLSSPVDSERCPVMSMRFDKETFWNTNRGFWQQTAVTAIKTVTQTSSGIVQKESPSVCEERFTPHPPPIPNLTKPRLYKYA